MCDTPKAPRIPEKRLQDGGRRPERRPGRRDLLRGTAGKEGKPPPPTPLLCPVRAGEAQPRSFPPPHRRYSQYSARATSSSCSRSMPSPPPWGRRWAGRPRRGGRGGCAPAAAGPRRIRRAGGRGTCGAAAGAAPACAGTADPRGGSHGPHGRGLVVTPLRILLKDPEKAPSVNCRAGTCLPTGAEPQKGR